MLPNADIDIKTELNKKSVQSDQ